MLKIYEILCRAHEIRGDKEDLKKLALMCARKFNDTDDSYIFAEMVKISLTGMFAKITAQKAKCTVQISKKLIDQGKVKNESASIQELKKLAKSPGTPVIEKLIIKLDFSEKVWG